jgi:hypothetical protein
MKTSTWPQPGAAIATAIVTATFFCAVGPATAQQQPVNPAPTAPAVDWNNPIQSLDYDIRGVKREAAPGYVETKSGWEKRVKCIQARVEYKGREPYGAGSVRAYFYNREGKLIDRFNKAPRRQDDQGEYIEAPERFERGKPVEVYFPITQFLEESDWATALIVFGNGKEASAETLPTRSMEPLVFDEKVILFPRWKPEAKPAGGAAEPGSVALEIRRLAKDTYVHGIDFNGQYENNRPCVRCEVRAQGEFPPADATVRLYLYDENHKLIGKKGGPQSARYPGSSQYFGRPRIGDDRWYPVVFALDGDLEDKKFKTALVVLQFAGSTIAEVETSNKATIAVLDFPEKAAIKP